MAKVHKSKWFRVMLSYEIAATALSMVVRRSNVSENVDTQEMADYIIESQVETQACVYKINDKHLEEMTQWAKDFYDRKLKQFTDHH
jgi:hypothetical protein